MTGLLILAGVVLLLILALAPAHRRASLPWRPGLDTRDDRDLARLKDELHAADTGPTVFNPHYPAVPFDPPKPPDATLAA